MDNSLSRFKNVNNCSAWLFAILLSISGLNAQLPSMKVSIDAENRPLTSILSDITAQTGLFFTYDASLIAENSRSSLHIDNLPLEQSLDSIFRDSSLSYHLIDRNIVINRKISQQESNFVSDESGTFYHIHGKVVDQKNGKALPFATIALSGTSIGTIANQEGEFLLKIPADTIEFMIAVSCIGFQNQFRKIQVWEQGEILVELNKDVISLQEVVIRYKDPASLLEDAISKIPENYLGDPSTMTAYYRENVQKNKKFLMFSEAVLEIAKEPYSSTLSVERVKILKGRKTINVDPEDTIMMKIKSGVKSSMELDIVKNFPDFMKKDFRDRYDYTLTDIVSYRNRLVYMISFTQHEHIRSALYEGELYLDMESLSLLAADFRVNPDYISSERDMFIIRKSRHYNVRPVSANYHVEYRQSDGSYHLNQVRGEVKFRMKKRKQWLSTVYSLTIEMAVTDVDASRKKIRIAEQLDPGVILADESFEYDPAFWGNYNTITPEASLQDVLERLNSMVFTGD